MDEKIPLLIFYTLAGLMLGLWPTLACCLHKDAGNAAAHHIGRDSWAISTCLLLIGFGWFWLGAAATPALAGTFALIAIIAAFHQGRIIPVYALAVLAGLMVAATLPWWRRDPGQAMNLSWIELSAFAVITTVALRVLKIDATRWKPSPHSRWILAALVGAFVLVAAILCFTTGIFHNTMVLVITWYHWGAYIQSSELLLAGARLFRDFPTGYGFGPTVLVASLCGNNCWNAMYYLTGLFTLLFALLITAIALDNTKQGLPQRGLILLLCLVSCFFWTGLPPTLSSPLPTPSVSGFRFLPVLALVALLLRFERRDNSQRHPVIWCHLAWAATALWSIESAFYATFVWWPYYLFLCSAKACNGRERVLSLLRALGILFGVFIALVLCFLAGYWLVYQTIPSAYGYFAYVLDPPGSLPVEGKGAVWYFIVVMALGIAANWLTYRQSGNSASFRRGFLLLLLAYGTFSYYLGRSDDNKILNLLPFQLLVLLNVRASPVPPAWREIAAVLLACMLGWGSMLGWNFVWRDTVESGKVLEFNLAGFRQALSYENPDTQKRLLSEPADLGNPADAARAIAYIRQNYGEPVTVINVGGFITSTDIHSVWSAIHGLAGYVGFSATRRREFLLATANTLKRDGWLIIHKGFPSYRILLADFDSVYTRTQEINFGSYYAIRYTPSAQIYDRNKSGNR